ncbi:hypothetical protein [Vulcanisaeta distributa]|uniref:hypothetical protein n=1 Tax=Vulcanisaeta distributa TaxID=164451 RepID=UPI0006D0951D|nr:hypothetical protein [Vulcanisaeta distributa]
MRVRLLSEGGRERRVERRPKVRTEVPRPKPVEKPQQALPRMELPINGLPVPPLGGVGGVVVSSSTSVLIRIYHSPGGLMIRCRSR